MSRLPGKALSTLVDIARLDIVHSERGIADTSAFNVMA